MKLHALLFSVLAACGSADANISVERDRQTFDRMLAEWDAMKPGAARDALAARVDRAAGQRYATTSRMYWHTDLAAAKAEAKRTNKPILSLRMLGRLDEDLSCANSRYFRIALYANTELGKFLRDSFVLHWSSERPVPRITIDFGNGKKLERTITGNSIHYVMDADARVIDGLPGLYAPAVFEAELKKSLALHAKLAPLQGREREMALSEAHRLALVERTEQWTKIARVRVPLMGDGFRPEAFAQLATVTKSGIEMPTYAVVDLGVKVGTLPDDANAWAQVGLHLMPPSTHRKDVVMISYGGSGRVQRRSYYTNPSQEVAEVAPPPVVAVGDVMDASSKALFAKLAPVADWNQPGTAAKPEQLARLVDRFERDILADTAINEFDNRLQIHGLFINQPALMFEGINEAVYAQVFHTPKADPWLGLAPQGVTALPRDGLVP
jgi:hypothetical protein